jgi:Tol biopolymer transport system component
MLLWVHGFDSVEDHPLAGTEDAAFPFWSPDSRNLGFFAQGKLKKIDLSAGPALALCDAPEGRGGTWSIEGEIVFATATRPLFRVSAAGGVPRQVTPSTASRASIAPRWPHFLPDSRHFLYWQPGQDGGLFLGTTGSPEVRALIPGASAAVFSNGHLLYVRGNVLLAQPFDPVRLQLTGEARPIAEGVGWSMNRGLAFSVSNSSANPSTNPGVLAYRAAGDPKTQLAWFDRQGRTLGPASEPGIIDAFSLSPDGTRAVVARRESEDGLSALWIAEFVRGVNMRLTFGPLSTSSPIWSPDGSRILFSARRDGGNGMFQLPANGSGKEELLQQTPGNIHIDSWSPSGRFIAYTAADAKGGSAIWALPLGSGDRKPMPILQDSFRVRQASFSPDERWIAYVSNESGRDEVYLRGSPSGDGKWLISSSGGTSPSWRRDGRELFYVAPDGTLTAVGIASSASGIRPDVARPLF